MGKIAILIDGGFYRKAAVKYYGKKTPEERAKELIHYCKRHLIDRAHYKSVKTDDDKNKRIYQQHDLYRIFYYDCPSVSKVVYHPLLKQNIDLSKTDTYKWMEDFLTELTHMRKLALRLGSLTDTGINYTLKVDIVKKLLSGSKSLNDLEERDFELCIRQKAVDMKIGIDIASLAYKKQVDQIVLISGDSDFVPAAKLARREGIDFIIDSMGYPITKGLFEHIDGLQTYYKNMPIKNGVQNSLT